MTTARLNLSIRFASAKTIAFSCPSIFDQAESYFQGRHRHLKMIKGLMQSHGFACSPQQVPLHPVCSVKRYTMLHVDAEKEVIVLQSGSNSKTSAYSVDG